MTFNHATTFLEALLCNSRCEPAQNGGWHAAPADEARRMLGVRAPFRLLVAMDGSLDVQSALDGWCSHPFAAPHEARVVTVLDAGMTTRMAGLLPLLSRWNGEGGQNAEAGDADEDDFEWIWGVVEAGVKQLRDAGFRVTQTTREGDLMSVLRDEARRWKADCILVGALSPLDLNRLTDSCPVCANPTGTKDKP